MQEEFENKIEDIVKAQQGDKKAMQYLVESNKGLIWSIVKRFQDRGYELEDLYHVAELQIKQLYDLDLYLSKLRKKDFEVTM